MHQGVIKVWLTASLLALLAACTVAPSDPSARLSPLSSRARPVVQAPVKPETAVLGETAAPLPEVLADDIYRLTGEAARELERGQASWYGPRFQGRRTASGERYDKYALTAAHKTLPFGTVVRVSNLLVPGREVDVRINDRGPFTPGRVIDLSQAAAEALGLLALGVVEVSLTLPESTALNVESAEPVRKVRRARRR
jgi:rare lipoprotein A